MLDTLESIQKPFQVLDQPGSCLCLLVGGNEFQRQQACDDNR